MTRPWLLAVVAVLSFNKATSLSWPPRGLTVTAAQVRSPRRAHSAARRMRPPSKGKPGIKLKTASMKLSELKDRSTATGGPMPSAAGPASINVASQAQSNPIAPLIAGFMFAAGYSLPVVAMTLALGSLLGAIALLRLEMDGERDIKADVAH